MLPPPPRRRSSLNGDRLAEAAVLGRRTLDTLRTRLGRRGPGARLAVEGRRTVEGRRAPGAPLAEGVVVLGRRTPRMIEASIGKAEAREQWPKRRANPHGIWIMKQPQQY